MFTKKGDHCDGRLFCELVYETGGKSWGVSGFFRKVKNPTPTGIRINISAKHTRAKPTDGDKLASLNVPWPAAVSAPNKQRNKPGHPQSNTVATVAMMPVFLLFMMFFSKEMNLNEYTVSKHDKQGISDYIYASFSTLHALHTPDVWQSSYG